LRTVITGGAGFIGANLAHHWSREHPDDELVILDSLTYAGVRASLRTLEEARRIRFVLGDIADPQAVDLALHGAERVIHLAAESHVDRSIADPAPFLRTNVLGTQVLLEAARHHDVARFHHVSTDEVFGSLPLHEKNVRFEPDTPYAPRSPYAASKAASDHLVRAYFHTYGLAVTISNCGNNYGPFQHPEKFIPNFITRLIDGGRVPLYGNGENIRDWIHVEDHCRAIERITTGGRAGETYLVGAEQELSNNEVTRLLLKLFARDESAIEPVTDRPGHDLRYGIDPSFLQTSLGWKSEIRFSDGLARTVEWYRRHEDWWRPLLRRPA
jgi:dTDP-glucose 4,6-dehydratase